MRALCAALGSGAYEHTPASEQTIGATDEAMCGSEMIDWFGGSSARDRYVTEAISIGGGVYLVGDRWVVTTDGLEDAQALRAKAGGEVRS